MLIPLAAALALSVSTPLPDHETRCPVAETAPAGLMSLDRAITLALHHDMRRDVARAGVEIARTDQAIAAFRPPDAVRVGTEDFPAIGRTDNIDSLELTGSYTRVWERGGKREARERLAARGVDVMEAATARSDTQIIYDVRTLYFSALIARARQAVACMEIEHVTDLKSAIEARVRQAADPALAGVRASTELLSAQTDLRRFAMEEAAFLFQLSSLTGAEAGFALDTRLIETVRTVRTVDPGFSALPEMLELNARQRQAQARTAFEHSKRNADVTWSVGVRNFGAADNFGLVAGVSVPLGMGTRSDASLAKARAEERAIETERRALVQQVTRQAHALRQSALLTVRTLETLETSLIPQAEEALALAEEGYRKGALPFRDILDAHEVLIGLHKQRVDHIETYLMTDAALLRLSGEHAAREMQP
ncbi:TolC family protein [Eilatimonas milleporae]|uniref:Outer membrane protein TolC n=1 Tax=Eilatimonas milleporae TaxID=911205 RepID=A0A3M0CP05_9PROT|nr:TolC family protein [Eilatimonas milleporae]RMB08609.1 outer membrane protein TolC [Eilatimonas milleporae]